MLGDAFEMLIITAGLVVLVITAIVLIRRSSEKFDACRTCSDTLPVSSIIYNPFITKGCPRAVSTDAAEALPPPNPSGGYQLSIPDHEVLTN